MVYSKRLDGRGFDELRPIEAKAGVIKNAEGSAYFRMGKTIAYAAVYGPREMFPKFKQDPKKGVIRCNYNMMPFSGAGERVRPGPSRRSKEISFVTDKALIPTVDLEDFPNAVVDVYIELPQTDAGSRCCGINAAAIALADAGIPMRDIVASVAVGQADNQILVDLTYEEEHLPEYTECESKDVADIPVAIIPSTGQISLLQMDGIIEKDALMKALHKAKEVISKISEVQKNALKEKYAAESIENNE
ncbi:TPA: exosome complex exonuclease Rrp41 [Candidatus Woesearchaeota archaeon]|nr:exosome complex exonuclease Rrp41 [Candidatus Woesearchaeota archaeon]HIH31544.1 exosome complex exonuclease Rrp41 [Candidatus Woesearchaeota archaeon]HIH54298.1 exosome complex exonuclease Rrp41 [Candidatus Woesearchaeota archaeon]HIJ02512.1 exosome complex exonuclease Rrp41 [Candidatus Woesearchaeota archaeon]HIJ13442.1 exosome complex exonuclease Rrp41 [Candidatus Woesearchaeota archaeon]